MNMLSTSWRHVENTDSKHTHCHSHLVKSEENELSNKWSFDSLNSGMLLDFIFFFARLSLFSCLIILPA